MGVEAKGCCPEYVSRCWHVGEKRVWLVTPGDVWARLQGLGFGVGDRCECGLVVEKEPVLWFVAGPGLYEAGGGSCRCSFPLLVEGYGWYETAEEAEGAFERRL